MARELRNKDPELYRHLSMRTEEARFWMKPNKQVNRTIAGIVARYAEIFSVEITFFITLSNHYHLIAKAPLSNLDEFEENINREMARRINWLNHRTGKFWQKRYSDQPILGEDALLECFLYIVTNPVRHGLVKDPSLWPGFSTYKQLFSEATYEYTFVHHSAVREEDRITRHKLKLSPLPQFAGLSKKKRVEKIRALIQERVELIVKERLENGQGFLTPEILRDQNPYDVPREVSKSPMPACYSKEPAVIREYMKQRRERRIFYAEASARYRLGDMNALFPEHSFKPPLHRKPRLMPFKELPSDFFKQAA